MNLHKHIFMKGYHGNTTASFIHTHTHTHTRTHTHNFYVFMFNRGHHSTDHECLQGRFVGFIFFSW